MTHLRIWKFQPAKGREDEFALAYAANGQWAALFGKARGYLGTELYRPHETGGWWLTIDRWESLADFYEFQRQFGEEYRELDMELEGIAGNEKFVGAFEDEG